MSFGIQLVYSVAAIFFILGLKFLSKPGTARRGNLISSVGMLVAIVATLSDRQIVSFRWITIGVVIGTVCGAWMARIVTMTAIPQMVALLNGLGGLASLLVACEEYYRNAALEAWTTTAIASGLIIGGITFSGSIVAWAKLSETISGKPIFFVGQHLATVVLALLTLVTAFWLIDEKSLAALLSLASLAFLLGAGLVIRIGGADMPVVISLLNSYSGLAACATGFVLGNNLLIVTGSLVGASGVILTRLMCKAMNRSLFNVLFGGLGASVVADESSQGEVKPITVEEAYLLLEAARSVVIVPGYGLAAAQAQHQLRELTDLMEGNGTEVHFAIHPVAGRMPGHMNVLLAEANISYDRLLELDTINPLMPTMDVCLVVGANDIVNPAALEHKGGALSGMPIVEADRARTVIVLKRSMSPGFAGIENPLFGRKNARMLFGDAKTVLQSLVSAFKN